MVFIDDSKPAIAADRSNLPLNASQTRFLDFYAPDPFEAQDQLA